MAIQSATSSVLPAPAGPLTSVRGTRLPSARRSTSRGLRTNVVGGTGTLNRAARRGSPLGVRRSAAVFPGSPGVGLGRAFTTTPQFAVRKTAYLLIIVRHPESRNGCSRSPGAVRRQDARRGHLRPGGVGSTGLFGAHGRRDHQPGTPRQTPRAGRAVGRGVRRPEGPHHAGLTELRLLARPRCAQPPRELP